MELPVVTKVALVALIVYEISLHELAHAWAATWCGDPTPRQHGRLTWNPLAQLDLFYSVILPIVSYLVLHWPFGFAYCPIDPTRFRKPLRDHALTSLAGPLVNFIAALLFVGLLWVPGLASPGGAGQPPSWNFQIFTLAAGFSLMLGVFNLLPCPPLDGYAVLRPLLPLHVRRATDNFQSMGFVPLLLVFLLAPILMRHVWPPLLIAFTRLAPPEAGRYLLDAF